MVLSMRYPLRSAQPREEVNSGVLFIEEEIETWIWCWRQSGRPVSKKGDVRATTDVLNTLPFILLRFFLNSLCLSTIVYSTFSKHAFSSLTSVHFPPTACTVPHPLTSSLPPPYDYAFFQQKPETPQTNTYLLMWVPSILTFRGSLKVTVKF